MLQQKKTMIWSLKKHASVSHRNFQHLEKILNCIILPQKICIALIQQSVSQKDAHVQINNETLGI